MLAIVALVLVAIAQPSVACASVQGRRFVGLGVDRFTQERAIANLQFSTMGMQINGALSTFDVEGSIASRTMDGVFDMHTTASSALRAMHQTCSIAMRFSFESHDLHYVGRVHRNGESIDVQNKRANWQLYAAPQTCTMQTLAAGTYVSGDLEITLDGLGRLEYQPQAWFTSYQVNTNCHVITAASGFVGFVSQDNGFVLLDRLEGEDMSGVFHQRVASSSQAAIK